MRQIDKELIPALAEYVIWANNEEYIEYHAIQLQEANDALLRFEVKPYAEDWE